MQKTHFQINKMDCSAEEQMVRMKLESFREINALDFDLSKRQLTVFHTGDPAGISAAIESLNFDARLLGTEATEAAPSSSAQGERRLLWLVLLINFLFFAIELLSGFFSRSMGLVADSLDMLADAIVYGMSLYAVGRSLQAKQRVARVSGYFQMVLAILGFVEVLRRFFGVEATPEFRTMIVVSLFALAGNAASLLILQRSKSREAHIRASLIFTSNDVLVNLGVIVAGIAVYFSHSKYPDLIVGSLVFVLVARGAVRILKLG